MDKTLYASSIIDNGNHIYKIKAPVSDEYELSIDKGNVIIYDNNNQEITNNKLVKNKIYTLDVKSQGDFKLTLYPKNKTFVAPFKIKYKPEANSNIKYKKRKGGSYLYSNVPEAMPSSVVNTILMENKDLSGSCFLTFEHNNKTSNPNIYMGYRIINTEDHDIYVTITNVGYQIDGSWLGDKCWSDYYGTSFKMPLNRFKKGKVSYDNQTFTADEWFKAYLNFDTKYEAKPIKPTTYKIPAGKYIYIIGGTTEDSYRHINVNNTADKKIRCGECINGNIKFEILNGKAIGQLCVYDDYHKLNEPNVIIQDFHKYSADDDLGGRIGISHHEGLLEANPTFIINDDTQDGRFPVSYDSYYADKLKEKYKPFEKIRGSYLHHIESDKWFTHLSSQMHHEYIGTDMVENETSYQGKKIILSVNKATPAGKIWDFGNWMIEYHDNFTFINEGNKKSILNIYIHNGGSLFYFVKTKNGKLLKAGATLDTCTGTNVSCYKINLKPHSKKVISFQYMLLANNNGSIEHYITLNR